MLARIGLIFHLFCDKFVELGLRELEGVWENGKHQWAKDTKSLLEEMHRAVKEAGGVLEAGESEKYRQRYWLLLKNREAECPPPGETNRKGAG